MSQIVFNAPIAKASFESQIENYQTTLASLNQQIITLRETLQERDQKIAQLEMEYTLPTMQPAEVISPSIKVDSRNDDTLTIIEALINLIRFLLPPRKESTVPVSQ